MDYVRSDSLEKTILHVSPLNSIILYGRPSTSTHIDNRASPPSLGALQEHFAYLRDVPSRQRAMLEGVKQRVPLVQMTLASIQEAGIHECWSWFFLLVVVAEVVAVVGISRVAQLHCTDGGWIGYCCYYC